MATFIHATVGLALGLGAAAAYSNTWAETVTWSRATGSPPASLTLPVGTVLFTRILPTDNAPTATELATRMAELERQQVETRTYAAMQAELAQAKAEKEAIATTMAAATQHVATQTAATEARLRDETRRELASVQELANTRLSAIEQMTRDNRALASAETARMEAALRAYAEAQLAAVRSETSATIAALAASYQLQTAQLQQQAEESLQTLYQQATATAERLVNERAKEMAEQVATLQNSTLTEAQVKALTTQALDDAQPQFQALALQTLKDAQGYVKTLAQGAVADADPAMQQALGKAVGQALAEEKSPAAFSMRRAIVDELSTLTSAATSGTATMATRLGDDVEPAAGPNDTIALDAARLRLGRLLTPGAVAAGSDTQTAMLPVPDSQAVQASISRTRMRTDLMNIRDYKVVVHADNQTLPEMMAEIMNRAEPFAGPWQVRWKLKPENQDLLTEKFSLDAETTFAEFVGYLAQFMVNDRGVKLSFSLFDRERVMLVSD